MPALPIIDQRTEKEIAAQVQALIQLYQPNWKALDPVTQQPTGPSAALIKIFARYASLIINRLNQAPEKNFLAFLDLLGATNLPPEPARVPLTFLLSKGSTADTVVPARTQAAAPPAEGEKAPVIFETERELVVTAAQLTSLYARNPETDQFANQTGVLATPVEAGSAAFAGNQPIEHVLYIGAGSLLNYPLLESLTLQINLAADLPDSADPRTIQWEFWDGQQGQPLVPATDETNNLTQSGIVTFNNVLRIPEAKIQGKSNRWLRVRLLTPITPAAAPQAGMVRSSQLPVISSVSLSGQINRQNLPVQAAFANTLPVDLSKDFFPFGEKPRFGDTFYLAHDEAFASQGAKIIFHVAVSGAIPGVQLPSKNDTRSLAFEFWDGAGWQKFTVALAEDGTIALTQTGDITLEYPKAPAPTSVNGMNSYWIRLRLASGDYGGEAQYVPLNATHPKEGYQYISASYTPPSINAITIDYSLSIPGSSPEAYNADNDFRYAAFNLPFAPFQPNQDADPALYLGFSLPPKREKFPNRTLSLYFLLKDILYGHAPDNPAAAAPPHLIWEYWNGADWLKLAIRDETDALTHSGLVDFLPPPDFAPSLEFGLQQYWLRLRWESGDYKFLPKLRTVLLNTTIATQAATVQNEILGSSNGQPNQTFRTTRAPVLKDQRLQVREADIPPADELAAIQPEEGDESLEVKKDAAGNPSEIWVRWQPVPDFYASGPRDRHYIINHLSGEIRFGDGVNGKIPLPGKGNLVMKSYRTGGGASGNRAANTIAQLKTTVPYIDKVINPAAAGGGVAAETLESLLERAPRMIRHRNRAVTFEDYEDLALLASAEVARAKCLPLVDLTADPDAKRQAAGTVSVIVVPRSVEPKPAVSLELLERVQAFLTAHSIPTANLVVAGPDYVRVDVSVEVALASLDASSEVEMNVEAALKNFLHPLTGGPDGKGWEFGRQPYKSDLYATLGILPGIDHLTALEISLTPDRPGADMIGQQYLIYAGAITVKLNFDNV